MQRLPLVRTVTKREDILPAPTGVELLDSLRELHCLPIEWRLQARGLPRRPRGNTFESRDDWKQTREPSFAAKIDPSRLRISHDHNLATLFGFNESTRGSGCDQRHEVLVLWIHDVVVDRVSEILRPEGRAERIIVVE